MLIGRAMKKDRQRGAASLFIVIFTMLLVTIITISFVRLMVNDQQQASNTDLSQSAYDSATAGVEDTKRALVTYQATCLGSSSLACNTEKQVLVKGLASDCNAPLGIIGIPTGGEVKVQTTATGTATGDTNNLDQAYTCVKVQYNTSDFEWQSKVDESKVVPLKGTAAFNKVKIEWYTKGDLPAGAASPTLSPISASLQKLPQKADWGQDRPPLLESQFIQAASSFTLNSLNSQTSTGQGTLYLYPSATGLTEAAFSRNPDISNLNAPTLIQCNTDISAGSYACSAILSLGTTVNPENTALLKLTSRYSTAQVSISLLNDTTPVTFDGVQPAVDSTGRANDLFRRIKGRIELSNTSLYPDAAIDSKNNLCKDFLVTDKASDYQNKCSE